MSGEENQTSYWQEQIESWRASGLTRKNYCEKENIDLSKFLYRQTRCSKKPKGIHFREMVLPTRIGGGLSGLQVLLPNGVRLNLGGELTLDYLETLLVQLGRLKCSD